MKIDFHNIEDINEERIKYVTLLTVHKDKLVLVKHRDRNTWEFPGGHIESDETCIDAAGRELYEETGATDYEIQPLWIFNVLKEPGKSADSFAKFYFVNILKFGKLPDFEIEKVQLFESLPDNLTYKEIQETLYLKYSGD